MTPKPPTSDGSDAALDALPLRDAETVELLVDFIAESEEGLSRVDEILLGSERRAIESEQVNELFRVFHTIKGLSGFLGATDVTALAHATETLLDGVRSGKWTLSGPVLEAVFDASATMRGLLAVVRSAVTDGREIPESASLVAIVERISRAHSQAAVAVAPAPESPITEDESPDAVDAASAPRVSGPKLRETVKVDLERVDSVVEMIGELIIVESMVVNAPEISALPSLRIRNYLSQLTKISRDLQGVAMRMRMIPVRGVFQRMARLARDLSRKIGKEVQVLSFGETTEMDRSMVERIEEPLVHMIRNAMDHAIELPRDRAAAGKPAHGTIRLVAQHEGGSIAIEVSDDGRGLRRDAILAKARERGLVGEGAEQMSDEDVFALIFLPGFSTAAQVSEISGRGVGMDVVKRSIEAMRGRIVVSSTPSAGTTFKLVLPLTLAIIDGMLVTCADETYIIPSRSIVESIQVAPSMVRTVGDRGELLDVRGEILPLVRLRRVCCVPGREPGPEESRVVIVESAGKKTALLVDEVVTEQQIVVKPITAALGDAGLLAGAAILSDGRVGLILDVDRLNTPFSGGRRRHHDVQEVVR